MIGSSLRHGFHRRGRRSGKAGRRRGMAEACGDALEPRLLLADVGGIVWEDLNVNGIREAGEPRLGGIVVELLDQLPAVVASATTDESGVYQFTEVAVGVTYSVRVNAGTRIPTLMNVGTDDTVDSDFDRTARRSAPFTLTDGQVLSLDAGLAYAAQFEVRLYRDLDRDGAKDSNETTSLRNRQVFIDLDGDGSLDSGEPTVTIGTSGVASFGQLPLGSYVIDVVPIEGWTMTTPMASRTVTLTGPGIPSRFVMLEPTGPVYEMEPIGPEIRLGRSTPVMAADSVGNLLVAWEEWVTSTPAVMARRYAATGEPLGAAFEVAPAGSLPHIAALADGGYAIAWRNNAEVWARRYDGLGNPVGGLIAVNAGAATSSADVPVAAADPAGGFVVGWLAQETSSARTMFRLFDTAGNPRTGPTHLDAALAGYQKRPSMVFEPGWITVTTGLNGALLLRRFSYTGEPLEPTRTVLTTNSSSASFTVACNGFGTYLAVCSGGSSGGAWRIAPDGSTAEYAPGMSTNGYSDPRITVGSDDNFLVTWRISKSGSGVDDVFGQLFNLHGISQGRTLQINTFETGEQVSPSAAAQPEGRYMVGWASVGDARMQRLETFTDPIAIGDRVWADADGNGVQDVGEFAQDGISVELYNADGARVERTTATGGQYRFSVLRNGGEYRLKFIAPAGKAFSPQYQGDPATDSDADPYGGLGGVFVAAPNDLSLDAGVVAGASLLGVVYFDGDGDAQRDADEAGLGGWTVYLDIDNDGLQDAAEPSVVSAADGAYSFANLPAGVQRVRLVPQYQWMSTATLNPTLATGEVLSGVHLGVKPTTPVNERIEVSGVTQNLSASHLQVPTSAADAQGNFVQVRHWHNTESSYDVLARMYDSGGAPRGAEFTVNQFTAYDQLSPTVAMWPDGHFVVAWSSYAQDGSDKGVYARMFNADGTPMGDEIQVNTTTLYEQSHPTLAIHPDGRWMVVFYSGYGTNSVLLQRFGNAGQRIGSETRVNPEGVPTGVWSYAFGQFNATGDFVVVYEDPDGSSNGITARRFDANGNPLWAPVRVNTVTAGDQYYPAVSLDSDGSCLVAWTDRSQATSDIWVQLIHPSGWKLGAPILVNRDSTTGGQYAPIITRDATGYLIRWNSDVSGVPAQQRRILRYADPAIVGGRVFNDTDNDGIQDPAETGRDGVLLTLYNEQGAAVADATTAGGGKYSFELRPGQAYAVQVTPPTGYGPSLPNQGSDDALDSDFDRSTAISGPIVRAANQVDSSIDVGLVQLCTVNGTVFNDLDGDGNRGANEPGLAGWLIYIDDDFDGKPRPGQSMATTDANGAFTLSGTLPGVVAVRPVLQSQWSVSTRLSQISPTVPPAATLSGMLVGVRTYVPETRPVAIGSNIVANTFLSDAQDTPALATLPGGFVAVWASNNQDGSGKGIYAQRFDANGAKVGTEFRVNVTTAGVQDMPQVAADAAGNFMVAWQHASNSIYARRYAPDGTPLTSEFRVDLPAAPGVWPALAMSPSGQSAIAWRTGASNATRIAIQRFDSAGTPVGSPFDVAIPQVATQPFISLAGDGTLNLCYGRTTTSVDTYLRRFDATNQEIGTEQMVHGADTSVQAPLGIATDAAGRFAIIWYHSGTPEVRMRRYSAIGTPEGTEVKVGGASGSRAGLAYRPDGTLVAAWAGLRGTTPDLAMQIYNSAGAPQGAIWNANVTLGTGVAAAFDSLGNPVVAWASPPLSDVLLRRFTLDLPPQATSLGDIVVGVDAPDALVQLYPVFSDAQDADTSLVYSIASNSNTALFTSATIQTGGVLKLDFAAGLAGEADLRIRATDTKGMFADSLLHVSVRREVAGTAGPDTFTLRRNGSSLEVFVNEPTSAAPTFTMPLTSTPTLWFQSGEDDLIQLADPVSGVGVPANLLLSGGSFEIRPVAGATLPLNAGLLSIRAGEVASVRAGFSMVMLGLAVVDGAHLQLEPGGNIAWRASNLALAGGTIDIADNALIHNPSLYEEAAGLQLMVNFISDGRIASGVANPQGIRGIAAVRNDAASLGTPLNSLGGIALDNRQILVQGRLYGDADFDGVVSADDYHRVDAGYLAQREDVASGWAKGDFNYDGRIDIDDYFLIDTAYARQSGPLSAQASPAAVPTPLGTPVPMTPATGADLFGDTPISEDELNNFDAIPAGVL